MGNTLKEKIKITQEEIDEINATGNSILRDGREILDPTPLFVEGMNRPLSINERLERMVAIKVSRIAQAQGHETIEEAFDFDVDETENNTVFQEMAEIVPEDILPPSLNNQIPDANEPKDLPAENKDVKDTAGQ